jgi:hypothetical protein
MKQNTILSIYVIHDETIYAEDFVFWLEENGSVFSRFSFNKYQGSATK